MTRAQVETGHFCLRNSPLPGLTLPQEDKPFHIRIFFRGELESVGLEGWESAAGRYISWPERKKI